MTCARRTAGRWAYDCLHGHTRKHLAMLGPVVRWPRPGPAVSRMTRMTRIDDDVSADRTGATGLTIEAIVAVDPPREFRLHPRDRVVAYTAEAAGARQLFTLSLRSGAAAPTQITASEKADLRSAVVARRAAPRVRPRRRDLDRRGRRQPRSTRVVAKPGGGTSPRWSPDGHRLAFLSRRRGWSQVWLIDAPVPRRGRPQRDPRPPDADAAHGDRRGRRVVRLVARRRPDRRHRPAGARRGSRRSQIALVDVATGAQRDRRRRGLPTTRAPAGCPTARCSTSPTRAAGSRSSADRPTVATGSS